MKFSTLYSPNIMFILTANQNARVIMKIYEGLDGGSWYSLITKNLAIYSLSLKFWLIP